MLMLEENESFSLTANVLSPGYQSMVLQGYIVSKRSDGTYMAPLLPQLFIGADGNQLQTWRQYLPTVGSQVILSKPAGKLLVPYDELYWRKVREAEWPEQVPTPVLVPAQVTPKVALPQLTTIQWLLIGLAIVGGFAGGIYLVRKR